MPQLIYKNGCWTCKRAIEDPQQEYICPKVKEHWEEYQNRKAAEYLRKLGYSVQENIYQNNKNQVGDLSLKELGKKFQEQEARQKILTTQFQKISDVELIDELRKRVSQQNIKLSIYPHQEHIFITAKDITKEVSFPLPIEIKKT